MSFKTLTTTLLLSTSFLLFTACETKTQEETNNTGVQNPTTQTTDDSPTSGEESTDSDGSTTTTDNGGNTETGNDNITSGTDDNTTTGTNDNNTTTTPTITLSSLNLTIHKTSLNKDDTTPIKVMATYSDNTSKELTDKVEWIVTPSDAIQVTNTTLTALKDKATSIQAKVGTALSNTLNLTIAWVVNGHVLPPEPDKTLNDSTLLGIDVNDNGVRDDVERWIYTNYEDKHPIHVDIGMQASKGYKLVLETPERARAIYHEVDKAAYCEVYYKIDAELVGDSLLITEDIDSQYFRHQIYFNTKERLDAYLQYDTLLSGYTYALPNIEDEKKACNFNTDKYEE